MAGISGKRWRENKTSESTQKAFRDQDYFTTFNVRFDLLIGRDKTKFDVVSTCSATT